VSLGLDRDDDTPASPRSDASGASPRDAGADCRVGRLSSPLAVLTAGEFEHLAERQKYL